MTSTTLMLDGVAVIELSAQQAQQLLWLGACGQHRAFDYPTLQECERARDALPREVIGKGYAICAPKQKDKP